MLGYWEWLDGLEHGLAAHHAGLLPTFKEVVEQLFTRGLIKAVFATETLALGINMPARTVVLERLVKWNGETHADITPGEYTQLTGRAGRRGIDVEGHAVVLWQPGVDPVAVAGLASTRTYPLRSSFRPTYNMAVNLVDQVGRERAREILETSFAQFQADRAVVGLARQVRRNTEALDGYREAMTCDRGDFLAYAALRRAIKDRETELARSRSASRKAEAAQSLEGLRIGDVIRVPSGRRAGFAVVVGAGPVGRPGRPQADDPDRRPAGEAADGQRPARAGRDGRPGPGAEGLQRPQPAVPPRPGLDAADRRAARAAGRPSPGRDVDRGRRAGAGCGVSCARTRATAARTARTTPAGASGGPGCAPRPTALTRRVESRTNSVARTFDRVCDLLGRAGLPGRATGSRPRASGCAGSTPSWTCSRPSACGTGSGTGSTGPGWPPCSRR